MASAGMSGYSGAVAVEKLEQNEPANQADLMENCEDQRKAAWQGSKKRVYSFYIPDFQIPRPFEPKPPSGKHPVSILPPTGKPVVASELT